MLNKIKNNKISKSIKENKIKKKNTSIKYDVAIIGAGQTGLTLAKHLIKKEFKVLLIDKQQMGIKTSLDLKNFNKLVNRQKILKQNPHDFMQSLPKRLKHLNEQQNDELFFYLKNNVYFKFVQGDVTEIDEYALKVNEEIFDFKKLVFATGSYFDKPNLANLTKKMYFNLDEINKVDTFYENIAIYGTNIDALELANAFANLGTNVYLFDENVNPFNDFDDEIDAILKTSFNPMKINWCLEAEIINHAYVDDKRIRIEYQSQGNKKYVEVEKIFVTGNKVSETRNLNSKYDIPLNKKGSIIIDTSFKVKDNPNYYAIGDANGIQMDSSSQSNMQAITLARYLSGDLTSKFNLITNSFSIDIEPQIAFYGMNKRYLDDKNQQFNEFIFDFNNELNSKLLDQKSKMKVFTNSRHEILGVFLYGHKIKELLPIFILASISKIKFHKLATLSIPFYSKSEAIRDAAIEYELEFVGLSKKLQKKQKREERKEVKNGLV